MPLDGFDRLHQDADARAGLVGLVGLVAAGGDDATVLEALRTATDRGWARPIVVGPAPSIQEIARANRIALDGFDVRHAEGAEIARAAVAATRQGEGEARVLMKGRIATPELMRAVLGPNDGLRTGRAICQIVLMEIPRDGRRFLLADTGVCVAPNLATRIDILERAVELARALGEPHPRVALMAASETVKDAMPETVEAAEIVQRHRDGALGAALAGCSIEGPLTFDLAYAPEAGARKRIDGNVVGAADVLLFPNLLSANLTVKAIMYTADCRFGGVLRGTSAPLAFMSRADDAPTRLNSIALALRALEP